MDFSGLRRRKVHTQIGNNLSTLYPHDLQLYINPPEDDITLVEFEDLALNRLQLLRILEQAGHKGHKPFSDDWKKCIASDLIKENLKSYARLLGLLGTSNEPDYQARRADHISHFILRLAYCRSADLRRWFLSTELQLFKLRFLQLDAASIQKFLEINKLMYVPISKNDKEEVRNELIESTVDLSDISVDVIDFYKVPFLEVMALIKNRKVYLHKGFAYIPNNELVHCILTVFRTHLSETLAQASQFIGLLDDERVTNFLTNLHLSYTGDSYISNDDSDAFNIANLDLYSRNHFPLCMKHMHEVLRSTHHLKHQARIQYGNFIKGLGVTFEDSMKFWHDEFTKKIDSNQFQKQYSYNIKHMYGKVGQMTSYSPHSCVKIITTGVGPGEQHGCPYKHWDANVLKLKLLENISAENADDILNWCKQGHYQVACGKYFEYTHNQPAQKAINHPNQYVEESVNLNKENKSNDTIKNTPKLTPNVSNIDGVFDDTM